MNIYEYAIQMEKDGENYYRELANKSNNNGLKGIFTMLADEEVKHYLVIEKLQQKAKKPELMETNILENVKNVFIDMKEEKQDLYINTSEEAESYRKARRIEEMSQEFYLKKASEVGDGGARKIFLHLAKEEGKHLRIMENIVEFVTRTEPGNWLENAEWSHLEEY